MSDSDLKFVLFRDMNDGYRWRLSSATGETVEISGRGHPLKDECVREVYGLIDARYPGARRYHRLRERDIRPDSA